MHFVKTSAGQQAFKERHADLSPRLRSASTMLRTSARPRPMPETVDSAVPRVKGSNSVSTGRCDGRPGPPSRTDSSSSPSCTRALMASGVPAGVYLAAVCLRVYHTPPAARPPPQQKNTHLKTTPPINSHVLFCFTKKNNNTHIT